MSGQADTAGITEKWAEVGRAARGALVLLGYPEFPPCMPGEAEPCGASVALHVASYLATLKAVADHQLEHLGPSFNEIHGPIYWDARAELDNDCQGVH